MICPVISILIHTIMYLYALGIKVDVPVIMSLFIGVVFIIVGNYLPKCRQNYTIGIKIPWTLNDEDNWNKTHRFAGVLWTVAGFVFLATAFLGNFWIFLPLVLIMVIVPMIYSYILHKKSIDK